jgi:hypothetical protein
VAGLSVAQSLAHKRAVSALQELRQLRTGTGAAGAAEAWLGDAVVEAQVLDAAGGDVAAARRLMNQHLKGRHRKVLRRGRSLTAGGPPPTNLDPARAGCSQYHRLRPLWSLLCEWESDITLCNEILDAIVKYHTDTCIGAPGGAGARSGGPLAVPGEPWSRAVLAMSDNMANAALLAHGPAALLALEEQAAALLPADAAASTLAKLDRGQHSATVRACELLKFIDLMYVGAALSVAVPNHSIVLGDMVRVYYSAVGRLARC